MTTLPEPPEPDLPGGPDTGTATSVLERTQEQEQTEPGDHDRFAHYVRKEKIVESAVSGKPVVALCGKVWVPGRDPSKFPVCPACKAILEGLQGRENGGNGGEGSSGGRRWGFGRNRGSDGTGGA